MSIGTAESVPLVRLENVQVRFDSEEWGRHVEAVAGVSLDIYPGEVVGITGQSGAGKSTLALSLMGLIDPLSGLLTGRIAFDGRTVLHGPEQPSPRRNLREDRANFRQYLRNMRKYRGDFLFMIFQEPFASLNPYVRIGAQIGECLRRRDRASSRSERRAKVIHLLKSVGMPSETADQFPWELSGGMCQRAMFAMGLALNVRLLVADEPTSSLDVRTQWKIMEIMKGRSPRLGAEDIPSILLVTHDLRAISRLADRVAVMLNGLIVESGPLAQVLSEPSCNHPYTRKLRDAYSGRGSWAGEAPSPNEPDASPDTGCVFYPQCPLKRQACAKDPPSLVECENEPGHMIRCHARAEELGIQT